MRLELVVALLLVSMQVHAQVKPVTDCPLRDAPHSAESPLIDILLSDAASDLARQHVPELFELPAGMLSTEAPAFGAIITLRQAAAWAGAANGRVDTLHDKLLTLPVTDDERTSRCARYDNDRPDIDVPGDGMRILVFHKINGFDHGPTVGAATDAVNSIAEDLGWYSVATDKGGAFTPEFLGQFDAVVWNNVSGDVLTVSQRAAFRNYIEHGGGFLGLHGSGGDFVWFWDWYRDVLLGTQFIGHPGDPQFQDAQVNVETTPSGVGESLAPGWVMEDEWYSFDRSPRATGVTIIATLDESTYEAVGYQGEDLRMGEDHPIAWYRCVGEGRALYSAMGHRPRTYEEPHYRTLLADALRWAAGQTEAGCEGGQ